MNRTRWLFLVVAMVAMGLVNAGCVVETSCTDDNNNDICDIDEGFDCWDDDGDGVCWEDDCNDLDANLTVATVGDKDCDGLADADDCYDDLFDVYECVDVACTAADNYCEDAWYIVYCDTVGGVFYGADCQAGCTTDEAVWGQACANPAFAGECSPNDGACLCWCDDAMDECVNDYTIRYTREGNTYDVDCKTYCGGTCDLNANACACPG
jgi:hypothetical protein